MTTEHRFWKRVTGEDVNECWLWTGAKLPRGYGRFYLNGAIVYAHRYAYESMIAPIPDGLNLDHLCSVPACVNPWHLEPVTQSVNIARGLRRDRCPHGHALTGSNLLLEGTKRRCRTCRRVEGAAYRARKRQMARTS